MIQAVPETRERILMAAERLFAANGIDATSLRSIIGEADVNLAAVHYHFGSKDALLEAVFQRLFGPLNQQRLAMLDEAESRAGKRRPSLAQIAEAFIAPTLRLCNDPERGPTFMKLIGRMLAEPELFIERVASKQFAEIRRRFVDAVAGALPALPREEIMWRLMFGVGAMAHTMRIDKAMPQLSGGICAESNVDEHIQRLVSFIVAGLKAPATRGKR